MSCSISYYIWVPKTDEIAEFGFLLSAQKRLYFSVYYELYLRGKKRPEKRYSCKFQMQGNVFLYLSTLKFLEE